MNGLENDISHSLAALCTGGIILYPTDTIWGIGCDATNAQAIQKIYLLKKRESKKSMIVLVSDADAVKNFVVNPEQKLIEFLLQQDTPTTAIFNNAIHLPEQLINADGSIALRIVNDFFCKTLIGRLGAPLVSTSANLSGDEYPENFNAISVEIKNGVDYIVQHRQNEIEMHRQSSIIKLSSEGEIVKIR